MNWTVKYLDEAWEDLDSLDRSPKKLVLKAIEKVKANPLPTTEGGLGKPLGNKGGNDLTGFLKIKLRSEGIRVVYKVVRQEDKMLVIVIGARADEEVYDIARQRIIKYNL
ncbi:MAG: type II toxin-antitoxin system RelE/ParE family toxin [Oscillospiraceae bacterium]|nr:type II toxin-antitoxin system RelE/ParE family toxin [Oscillospiraceae bacterium]